MQSAVSDAKLSVSQGGKLSEAAVSRVAVNPPLVHRRGRKHVGLSWTFKLATAGAIGAFVAITLLIQA